jgi:Family of unknown function (DUF6364)
MTSEKVTLRMEGALIEKAKRVAKERDTSVSRMVAGFFDSLKRTRPTNRRHGQITSRLPGSVSTTATPPMLWGRHQKPLPGAPFPWG